MHVLCRRKHSNVKISNIQSVLEIDIGNSILSYEYNNMYVNITVLKKKFTNVKYYIIDLGTLSTYLFYILARIV